MALPVYDPPVGVPFAQPFWDAAERGELVLPRCSACGRWQWYPDTAGADCPGAEMVWDLLPGTGTIHTWTRVRRPFLPGQRDADPYILVLVEPDGAEGVRLVGNMGGDDDPHIGMRVSVHFEPVGNHTHPVFEPVDRPD